MKMKLSIGEMADALRENKEEILKRQNQFMKEYYPEALSTGKIRKNKRPHVGYVVPGISAYTQAVKLAGFTWYPYWSGSTPTPSTQYEREVYNFLKQISPGHLT